MAGQYILRGQCFVIQLGMAGNCCGQNRLCSIIACRLRGLTSHVLVPEALPQVRISGKRVHNVVACSDLLQIRQGLLQPNLKVQELCSEPRVGTQIRD